MGKSKPLEEIPSLIDEGASVAFGGGWFANHPMAAVRELLRARRTDIDAIALLGSVDIDLMIAAKTLRKLTFSMVTLEAMGLAVNLRRAVEGGDLPICEISALSLQVAIEAAARNVPFLPIRGPVGSDLVAKHPEVYGSANSSFEDVGEVMAVRAIKPDAAIVHALRCDELGNSQFDGTYSHDPEIIAAADLAIVTCEEIVPTEVIAENPHMTKIPGFQVDVVVEAPFGAHPCSHVPRYAMDAWEVVAYQRVALAGGAEQEEYVERIRNESEAEYRERVLGDRRGRVLEKLAEAGEVLA